MKVSKMKQKVTKDLNMNWTKYYIQKYACKL